MDSFQAKLLPDIEFSEDDCGMGVGQPYLEAECCRAVLLLAMHLYQTWESQQQWAVEMPLTTQELLPLQIRRVAHLQQVAWCLESFP